MYTRVLHEYIQFLLKSCVQVLTASTLPCTHFLLYTILWELLKWVQYFKSSYSIHKYLYNFWLYNIEINEYNSCHSRQNYNVYSHSFKTELIKLYPF